MDQPEIRYPCAWAFKVIGRDTGSVIAAIGECLGEREYECEPSNRSRSGRYCSVSLLTTVSSEEDRDRLFFALRDHASVTMVL